MGSAFHQLCPRYNGTLTPTGPTAIRLLGYGTPLPYRISYFLFVLLLDSFGKLEKQNALQITA